MESLVRGRLAVEDGVKSLAHRMDKEEGATAVEYALMVGLIAVVIIVAVTLLGNRVSSVLNKAASAISS
jgi:pilus assembly protein Flp/PilA